MTKTGTYILNVESNEPMYPDPEYWLRSSISELKECYEDWMEERFVYVESCEWNKPSLLLKNIDYIEDFDELLTLPSFGGSEPKIIKSCYDCGILYDHDRELCTECDRILSRE